MNIEPLELVVHNLFKTFLDCHAHNKAGEGGKMRAAKGSGTESFFGQLIQHALVKNNLTWHLDPQHRIVLNTPYGSQTVTSDYVILDGTDYKFHVECKDYNDRSMYTRTVGEHIQIKNQYPNIKLLSLSTQIATRAKTQKRMNHLYGINNSVFNDTLLSTTRNAKKNLFLLDHTQDEINQLSLFLIDRLASVLV